MRCRHYVVTAGAALLVLAGSILPGAAADLQPLIKKLSSPTVNDRKAAARELGKLRDPASIPALIEALKDTEPMVRLEVSGALMDLGKPVEDPLIAAVKVEKNSAFLWNAIRILEMLGDPKAIEPLKAVAKESTDPNIVQAANYTIDRLSRVKAAN
jgi:HEAT repeat protein